MNAVLTYSETITTTHTAGTISALCQCNSTASLCPIHQAEEYYTGKNAAYLIPKDYEHDRGFDDDRPKMPRNRAERRRMNKTGRI